MHLTQTVYADKTVEVLIASRVIYCNSTIGNASAVHLNFLQSFILQRSLSQNIKVQPYHKTM